MCTNYLRADFGRLYRSGYGQVSGVPQESISSIDSGTAEDVHASIVIGFAKALHVSADYL